MTEVSESRGSERVVLVDEDDRSVGTEEKLKAHRRGLLHRAFSVFVRDAEGRWLLQKRAPGKYHSGGLWSNTCCSHPRPGEPVEAAARRRLREEMGFACPTTELFTFRYRVRLGDELWEHELDHVLVGRSDAEPDPDPAEVEDWRWVPVEELCRELERDPERFTYWFREIAPRLWDEASARDEVGVPDG